MIRETVIDRALNRLSSHFGSRLVVRPPASAGELAALEAIVGPLPRELVIFLSTCNGLRINTEGFGAEMHLWNIHEMERAIYSPAGFAAPPGVAPLRGDADGTCDGLVLSSRPLHNAVVRWDAWAPGATVMATSFGFYLASWTEYLVTNFDGFGQAIQGQGTTFSAAFAESHDPDLHKLSQRREVIDWLQRLDRTNPSDPAPV